MADSRALANGRWERFCQLFVFGNPAWDPTNEDSEAPDTRQNATQSYIHAGYKARGASANVNASRLLRDARIQARIVELRKEEQRIAGVYLKHWKTLVPKAQAVLLEALEGGDVSAQAIQAAREVVEQAEGPTRFRFGVQKGGDTDAGLSITLWSGRNRGDD